MQILIDIKNISDEEIIDECKRCIPIQAKLLEILKIWDMFALKNKITYILDFGTLLGAIRHKGFIPWDDDIDVRVKYSDIKNIIGNFNTFTFKVFRFSEYVVKLQTHGKSFLKFSVLIINELRNLNIDIFLYPSFDNWDKSEESDFSSIIMLPFETTSFPVSINYHTILVRRYGDNYLNLYYFSNHKYNPWYEKSLENKLRKITHDEFLAIQSKL